MNIPYWQQRQQMKLKGAAPTPLKKQITLLGEKKSKKDELQGSKSLKKKELKPGYQKPKKKQKPIKKRNKKMAKKMRKLGKINKELLQDGTVSCGIQSPVCTYFAKVVNHNAGRVGDQLLNKEEMVACCQPCNDYIEAHHEWAEERGFKKKRHGPTNKKIILKKEQELFGR